MSQKHPIIAVTGSSGSGCEPVMSAFKHLFWREKVTAAVVQGDGFHRYDRQEMKKVVEKAVKAGKRPITHFGPEGNLLEQLEALFVEYGKKGSGKTRTYVHSDADAAQYGRPPGTFTEWEPLPKNTDLMLYQGLHGGYSGKDADIAKHADLVVGVTPIVNLEWIQKIHKDINDRGYSREAITHSILERMHDYVHYITPQFTYSHINFQKVPVVDTSNPFIARDVPTLDESLMVIRFRSAKGVDFPYLLEMIHDSFMSRPNTIVVPGGKALEAMELIFGQVLQDLMARKRAA